jgi:hypothetical protein
MLVRCYHVALSAMRLGQSIGNALLLKQPLPVACGA